MAIPVDIVVAGHRLQGTTQDLSQFGVFVRIPEIVAVGERVDLILRHGTEPLEGAAIVTHVLTPGEARSLGRFPGLGMAFEFDDRPFELRLHSLIEEQNRRPAGRGETMRIVIADGLTRLLERLSTALDTAGFEVATATNGAEALAACLKHTPDVVLCAADMPVVDGFRLVEAMGARSDLASIPVMLMSNDAGDLRRLRAFQLGVMDFIPKPFTVAELCIRVRRLARARRDDGDRVVLRGTLAELGLPALFTMFEQERKTGVLALTRDTEIAWLSFRDGRPVLARSSEIDADSRSILMALLDWPSGHFEFSTGAVDTQAELDESPTQLLLEHARQRDESRVRR